MDFHFFGHGKVVENQCWKRGGTLIFATNNFRYTTPGDRLPSVSCATCSGAATICPRQPPPAPLPCKWWLEQPIRAFRSEVTAHVCDADHRTPSVKQVWSSFAFPFRRHGLFFVTALTGLLTLTSDLSISKRGHVSPVSWASFLSIFSFLRPSVFELESGTWQTDRRTDRQWTWMHYAPSLWNRA